MLNRLKKNGMEINDEMIACYIEGSLNIDERNFVRKYLSENPERLEALLYIMDNDKEDYLGEIEEETDNIIPIKETSFSDIAYSAAAFVPQQKKQFTSCNKKHDSTKDFLGRLGSLCDEIGI